MSTVGELIDRLYREFLYPPREQPARTTLATTITSAIETIVYNDGILSVEEENSLGEGLIIELGTELILVTAVDTGTQTLTTTDGRGWAGTTPAAHTQGDELRLAPDYPRLQVFDAVADALQTLYPELFRIVSTETTTTLDWAPAPANVGEVVGCNYRNHGKWRSCGVKDLQGFLDSGTEVAFQFAEAAPGQRAYVRYKVKPTRVELEADDLADTFQDFAIEPQWEPIVILDAVAAVMATVDVDTATQEFVTDTLAAQGFGVGEGETLRDALLRLASFRRNQAIKVLLRQYPVRMRRDGYAYGDA